MLIAKKSVSGGETAPLAYSVEEDERYLRLFFFVIFWCATSLLAWCATSLLVLDCRTDFFLKVFILLLPLVLSLLWPKLLDLISSVGTSLVYGPNFPDLSYENRSYQDDMDKATRFVREGRWLEAIALYRTITQKAPRKPEPHFNLARLYQKLGHLGLAISEYKKITELKDELGDNQAYVVESERAIEDLSKLLKNCIHP